VPILEECPRYLVGRVLERLPLGDHIGHLLEPVSVVRAHASRGALSIEDVADVDAGHPA
jgi:flavin reductase (DIM6/NTAB) family NADH-FMN oxidoreductase RutF